MKPTNTNARSFRLNKYATLLDTERSIYVILEDQGTVNRIDKASYPYLCLSNLISADLTHLPKALKDWLIQRRIFVPQYYDERTDVLEILKRAEEDKTWQRLPASFHLFLTHTCNFRCTYCIQGHEVKHSLPHVITTEQIHLAFQYVRELCDRIPLGALPNAVTLFGGEPLLPITRTAVETAIDEAVNRSMSINVVTNGYYYDIFSGLFTELGHKTSVSFLVSLDGPCEIHNVRRPLLGGKGSFHKVVSNISQMLDAGAKVVLQPIIDETNVLYLEQLYNLCLEHGWLDSPMFFIKCGVTMFPNAQVFKMIPYHSAEKQTLDHLLRTSQKLGPKFSTGLECGLKSSHFLYTILLKNQPVSVACGCPAVKQGTLSFSPDGLVYPCREYAGRGERHAIARYAPVLEVFDEAFQSWYHFRVDFCSKCYECKHILICGGGCRVRTETSGNSLDDPICPDFEAVWGVFLDTYDSMTNTASNSISL